MGWLRDWPDFRDYTLGHDKIAPLFKAAEGASPAVDLRQYCSPVEDQGNIGSCTLNALAGLVEYHERRTRGKFLDVSRLFLYKASKNMLHWSGDTGMFVRTAMGALKLFGACPEAYWPYDVSKLDEEPPAFCYAFGQSFQSISYYRLDNVSFNSLVARIKGILTRKQAVVFGFTAYSSIVEAGANGGLIPYPIEGESAIGGHAVLAVGYDDDKVIKGQTPNAPATMGAFLIKNSWGEGWGDAGYGWLPYYYAMTGLTADWWALTKAEWVETGSFKA